MESVVKSVEQGKKVAFSSPFCAVGNAVFKVVARAHCPRLHGPVVAGVEGRQMPE